MHKIHYFNWDHFFEIEIHFFFKYKNFCIVLISPKLIVFFFAINDNNLNQCIKKYTYIKIMYYFIKKYQLFSLKNNFE